MCPNDVILCLYFIFRWICIYPAYINSKKTLAQGRRIAKEKAIEHPTHQEIRDVLVAAGMKVQYQSFIYTHCMKNSIYLKLPVFFARLVSKTSCTAVNPAKNYCSEVAFAFSLKMMMALLVILHCQLVSQTYTKYL